MVTPRRRRVTSQLGLVVLLIAAFLPACAAGTDSAAVDAPAAIAQPTTTPPTPTALPSPTVLPTPTVLPEPTALPSPTALPATPTAPAPAVLTGAAVLVARDFDLLQGLRVGLITHRPSVVNGERLADLIHQAPGVDLVALFAPEHGLDGTAAAGELVSNTVDAATSAPIFSLYGIDRSPTDGSLSGVDVLVYDLQDVGSRFFTYTSTLGLSMQAASEAGIAFVVLDRPNPLGSALHGPNLAPGTESFIGLYPIPSAYGLTSGELALLIQKQRWLDGLENLDLRIVEMANWRRDQVWVETGLDWIAPSPNLPTADAALIYPGTVLFEATSISEGRGTAAPFLTIGAPWINADTLAQEMNSRQLPGVVFEPAAVVPQSIPQAAPNPRYRDQEIFGVHIRVADPPAVAGLEVGLHLLDAVLRHGEAQGISPGQIIDRPEVFDRLAGNPQIRADLAAGRAITAILESIVEDHEKFAALAAEVLLYD